MILGLLIAGCADVDSGAQLADEEVRYALPTAEFTDVDLRHTDAGELTFRLLAPNLDRYDHDEHDQRAVFYGGITIFFYEEGRESSRLTSDRGEVLRGGEELLALGNVVVTTDTGTTILTPRMRWTKNDKLITSDTTVTIITESDTLRGTGLVATDDLRMRRVLNPTGVSYRTKGQGAGGIRLSELGGSGSDSAASDTVPPPLEPGMPPVGETVVGPDTTLIPPPPPPSPFEQGTAPKSGAAPRNGVMPKRAATDSLATGSTAPDTAATAGGGTP